MKLSGLALSARIEKRRLSSTLLRTWLLPYGVGRLLRVSALTHEPPKLSQERITELSDEELAQKVAEGNDDAFSVIMKRHAPRLGVMARRRFGGTVLREDIEEIVSDVFFDAWRRRHDYDPTKAAY